MLKPTPRALAKAIKCRRARINDFRNSFIFSPSLSWLLRTERDRFQLVRLKKKISIHPFWRLWLGI